MRAGHHKSPTDMCVVCSGCGREFPFISRTLELCGDCLRSRFDQHAGKLKMVHTEARRSMGLTASVPTNRQGKRCYLCVNECLIGEGQKGYCNLRRNVAGRFVGASADNSNVSWYYDALPTNCVASWVCPGGVGAGYPDFAHRSGAEYGYKNLAVFYQACSFDCLFCQNWQYRLSANCEAQVTASFLADQVDETTACICYFGGDPSPQLPHAIRTSRLALKRNEGRILRICWETNGSMHPLLLRQAAELSLQSGGCIKFDLKAWNEGLHIALCGVTNRRTLDNFKLLAKYTQKRPHPPFLVASTLLIPGYIDREEVAAIASFIALLNPDIPYSLLAFHPQFLMGDLPVTSRRLANECLEAAQFAGLTNVRIGNIHLLADA